MVQSWQFLGSIETNAPPGRDQETNEELNTYRVEVQFLSVVNDLLLPSHPDFLKDVSRHLILWCGDCHDSFQSQDSCSVLQRRSGCLGRVTLSTVLRKQRKAEVNIG
jgi:hypothetical protein